MKARKIILFILLFFSIISLLGIVLMAKNKYGPFEKYYENYTKSKTIAFSKTIQKNIDKIYEEIKTLSQDTRIISLYQNLLKGNTYAEYNDEIIKIKNGIYDCNKIQLLDQNGLIFYSTINDEINKNKFKSFFIDKVNNFFKLTKNPFIYLLNKDELLTIYPINISDNNNGYIAIYYKSGRLIRDIQYSNVKIPYGLENFIFLSGNKINTEGVKKIYKYYKDKNFELLKGKNTVGGISQVYGINVVYISKNDKYIPWQLIAFIIVNLLLIALIIITLLSQSKEEKLLKEGISLSSFNKFENENEEYEPAYTGKREEIKELFTDIEEGVEYTKPETQKGIEEMIMLDSSPLTELNVKEEETITITPTTEETQEIYETIPSEEISGKETIPQEKVEESMTEIESVNEIPELEESEIELSGEKILIESYESKEETEPIVEQETQPIIEEVSMTPGETSIPEITETITMEEMPEEKTSEVISTHQYIEMEEKEPLELETEKMEIIEEKVDYELNKPEEISLEQETINYPESEEISQEQFENLEPIENIEPNEPIEIKTEELESSLEEFETKYESEKTEIIEPDFLKLDTEQKSEIDLQPFELKEEEVKADEDEEITLSEDELKNVEIDLENIESLESKTLENKVEIELEEPKENELQQEITPLEVSESEITESFEEKPIEEVSKEEFVIEEIEEPIIMEQKEIDNIEDTLISENLNKELSIDENPGENIENIQVIEEEIPTDQGISDLSEENLEEEPITIDTKELENIENIIEPEKELPQENILEKIEEPKKEEAKPVIDFKKVFSEPPIRISTISDINDYSKVATDLARNNLNMNKILILKQENGKYVPLYKENFNVENFELDTNDLLYQKVLSKKKSIDIINKLDKSDYLKEKFPIEDLKELEELFVVPVIKENDIVGLSFYGREKGKNAPSFFQRSELYNLGFLQIS